MHHKRSRRRPDLFSVLLAVALIGLTLTLGYQINLYYGGQEPPMATQAPAVPVIDG
jgi:hypothetical protein